MNSETDIQLSGPFSVTDAAGRKHDIQAIRIFDEGYGIIDVYVDFAAAIGKERLFEDQRLIGQIIARLRQIGYVGPDFGHGDLGLQDDKLIVLEAPEEFNAFAASKGWTDLAAEFAEDEQTDWHSEDSGSSTSDSTPSSSKLDALKNKFKA